MQGAGKHNFLQVGSRLRKNLREKLLLVKKSNQKNKQWGSKGFDSKLKPSTGSLLDSGSIPDCSKLMNEDDTMGNLWNDFLAEFFMGKVPDYPSDLDLHDAGVY